MLVEASRLNRVLRSVNSQADRAILALATFDNGASPKDIKSRICAAGFAEAEDWPIGSRLRGDKRVKKRKDHYVLTSEGLDWVSDIVPSVRESVVQTQSTFAKHVKDVADHEVQSFVLEAITAFESGLFRSAIVMSWLAAVYVLQREVFQNHRKDFDQLMQTKSSDWKQVKSLDDYGRLNEAQFLDRLNDVSVIGKNVKAELKQCLDRRNACGHPNSYKVTENTVAHHIDVLLVNVFLVFQPD
ncbi:MAG: hypothetical protein AAGL23_15950 [Pseudomonadota bacterium]